MSFQKIKLECNRMCKDKESQRIVIYTAALSTLYIIRLIFSIFNSIFSKNKINQSSPAIFLQKLSDLLILLAAGYSICQSKKPRENFFSFPPLRWLVLSNLVFSLHYLYKSLHILIDVAALFVKVLLDPNHVYHSHSGDFSFFEALIHSVGMVAFFEQSDLQVVLLKLPSSDRGLNKSCVFEFACSRVFLPLLQYCIYQIYWKEDQIFIKLIVCLFPDLLKACYYLVWGFLVFQKSSISLLQKVPKDISKNLYNEIDIMSISGSILECTKVGFWCLTSEKRIASVSLRARSNTDHAKTLEFAHNRLVGFAEEITIEIDSDNCHEV